MTMRGLGYLVAIPGLLVAQAVVAHEYPLQFTANSGARGLVVAGYAFSGDTVLGNCSYYTLHSGSGRGGGYKTIRTDYNQTCTWDLFGNLLGIAPGAPVAPAPLATVGTRTIYARNAAHGSTGTDSTLAGGGFVVTKGSHYSWVTPNTYVVLQQQLYSFPIQLKSDGDFPLVVTAVDATSNVARIAVPKDTCIGTIAVGHTCTITVTYDPTKLSSPTGLAYDTLALAATSDAGQAHDFVQSFTLVVKVPVDDGGN